MAFRDISLSIQDFFASLGSQLRDPQKSSLYMRYGAYATMLVLAGGLLFAGRNWYITSRERSAEKDLSAYVSQYYHALGAADASWSQVASLFEVGYTQHSGSYLAPYFLAYQADALLQQNAREEAAAVMKTVLQIMPESAPLYQLLCMKYYLILLDIPEHPEHDAALTALYEIGSDKTNNVFEIALFYLGRYHFVHHNIQEARNLWQELCATAVDENPSPLVQEAEEYLHIVG